MKHLKKYEGAIEDLVRGVNGCHDRVDNRKAEVNSLKGRVLDLETRNVLLEAKVWDDSGLRIYSAKNLSIGRVLGDSR